ncbi:MAG: hypothetical protein AMJ92_10480 [candidate division Zixibacteria bacterium SM23_81]|nr:MAG: hypothetical protein AMJ92_10480 [candidate division Zixibacteria bacterium SM23_81]
MVRPIVFLLLITVLFYGTVAAQDSGFGLGIILGEPTGLSLKQWVDGKAAIDGAIAWSFGRHDALHLHADYLVHNFTLFKMEQGKLPLYYGIGGRIKFEENGNDEDTKIGVRIPVGISYILANSPLDIFLEIAPLLDLTPSTEFDLNGAIGIRYFFHKGTSEARD